MLAGQAAGSSLPTGSPSRIPSPPPPHRPPSGVKALADFMAMLAQDSSRAFYGPGHVHAAHEMGAIQVPPAGGLPPPRVAPFWAAHPHGHMACGRPRSVPLPRVLSPGLPPAYVCRMP